jgi:hypothetical protein
MHQLEWQDIAVPLILFLTGCVLMGADWTGMVSLDRIANLWPSAVILVGLAATVSGRPGRGRAEPQGARTRAAK